MSSKTYLVTGAAGFIGARFVESCQAKKIETISVDRTDYFSQREEHQGVTFGRCIDRDHLFDHLREERPSLDAVVHLGACTDTTEMDESYLTKTNLEYSQSLWKYCHEHQIPMIYASSAATYGDGKFGYDDDEEQIPNLKPLNPYGVSKQRFDLWALDQESQGNKPSSWSAFKFFNVFGFGETHKKAMSSVVLKAFNQISSGATVKLFKSHRDGIADGEQKRDFIYVEDVVSVLHFAIEKPIPRGIFNLGTGRARSFLDLVRGVFQSLEKPVAIEFVETPIEIRDRYQYFTEANMQKLISEGYEKDFHSLEEGVKQYVERLKRHRA